MAGKKNKKNKPRSRVVFKAALSEADWRVVREIDGSFWIENIFRSEYNEWSRFDHWGSFSSLELAKIAISLTGLMDYDDQVNNALRALLQGNKGFLEM